MKKSSINNNTRSVRKTLSILIIIFFLFFAACSNADLLDNNSPNNIQSAIENEPNLDELFLLEMSRCQSRGNFGDPDFNKEGQMFYIYLDSFSKSYISRKATFSEAVKAAKECKWIDVNGSGTSLNAAIESTKLRARTLSRNMVLVYIAQGMDYWDAEDETFKKQYNNLIKEVTQDGTKIYATSHSWSGHIVARIVRDNPLVTHFAINPAHGNLKEGEKVEDYVADLQITKSPTYIMAGTSDLVARYGGGTAWKGLVGIVGYNSVYYGINGNKNVSLIKVKDAGHLIEDMIEHGGFGEIKKLIR